MPVNTNENQYGSLRYVDHFENNFLFRGPAPIIVQTVDYDGLVAAIRKSAPPSSPIPQDFFLIDINLLHSDDEKVCIEYKFFQKHPNLGEFIWWETDGTETCYYKCDLEKRTHLVATLDEWLEKPSLITRVNTIRNFLKKPPDGLKDRPIVIYVHCYGGCDRTGEMIGAYMLRYMQKDWMKVYEANQPCGQPPGCNNYRALQWYAYWLNTQPFGIKITGIGNDGGCKDPEQIWKPCSPESLETVFIGTRKRDRREKEKEKKQKNWTVP